MRSMHPPVWEKVDDYESLWAPFDKRFNFRAGMTASAWPAIDEPPGSITFGLAPLFHGAGTAEWLRHAVNFAVIWALAQVNGPDEPLFAIDWQHSSYRFWPHANDTIHPSEMLSMNHITPIPDGDYYAFVSHDYDFCLLYTSPSPRD